MKLLELEEKQAIVHRIETLDGYGPYEGAPSGPGWCVWLPGKVDWKGRASWLDRHHPTPGPDGIDTKELTRDHRFGHANIAQVVAWWGDALDLLPTLGWTLATYRVAERHVLRGRSQVAFIRDRATLLGRSELSASLTTITGGTA